MQQLRDHTLKDHLTNRRNGVLRKEAILHSQALEPHRIEMHINDWNDNKTISIKVELLKRSHSLIIIEESVPLASSKIPKPKTWDYS